MVKKFDFSNTVDKLQKSLEKDKYLQGTVGLGSDLHSISTDPKDYVVMPKWWKQAYGVHGMQFGRIIQIAGLSDSGKTSLCIEAMKNAQEQGIGIVYVETEGKTSPEDLEAAGLDTRGIITVNAGNILEVAFEAGFKAWDEFFKDYPGEKLLFIFDSYGNTVSLHDSELDMTRDSMKPGGSAKANRLGLGKIIAKLAREKRDVACLFVNYTYDNIGSHGKTNAGGQALNFYNMISIQASRTGWVTGTKTKDGKTVKIRKGAVVKWQTYKNHYEKHLKDSDGNKLYLPTAIELKITEAGFEPVNWMYDDVAENLPRKKKGDK